MTAGTALIVAAGTILGVILGAVLTYRLQRKTLTTARTHQLEDLTTTRTHQIEDRIAADTARARDLALDAYVEAREGIAWLHSVRVEDTVLDPWRTDWASDLQANLDRIRTARRNLDRASAMLGHTPLGQAARSTAHQLLLFETAWIEAREAADGYHHRSAKGSSLYTRYGNQMLEHSKEIDTARELLIGLDEIIPEREIKKGGHTDDSLLGRLRTQIGNATRAQD